MSNRLAHPAPRHAVLPRAPFDRLPPKPPGAGFFPPKPERDPVGRIALDLLALGSLTLGIAAACWWMPILVHG